MRMESFSIHVSNATFHAIRSVCGKEMRVKSEN